MSQDADTFERLLTKVEHMVALTTAMTTLAEVDQRHLVGLSYVAEAMAAEVYDLVRACGRASAGTPAASG